MANQMIALQARNPQLPDPSRAAAQYSNMMNMASQQRASQLQAERIRQEMDFEAAKEARAVETQPATMREKDLDIEDKELATSNRCKSSRHTWALNCLSNGQLRGQG